MARVAHISIAVGSNIGPLDVVMVIIESEVLVGKVGVGVTSTPLVVHHLDVNKVGSCSAELRLHGTNARESGAVESLDEGRRRWPIRFVNKLDGTGTPEVGVGVNDIGDPFEELVSALVVVVVVEPRRRCVLASEGLFGTLSTWRAVKIDNDIETGSLGPSADTFEVRETTTREMFTAIHEGFQHPVSDGNTDSVESETFDLVDIGLGDPSVPMGLECSIGPRLAKLQDTVELGLFVAATHCVPLIAHHPGLDDEETAQVDTADFICCWEPRIGHTGQKRPANEARELHDGESEEGLIETRKKDTKSHKM